MYQLPRCSVEIHTHNHVSSYKLCKLFFFLYLLVFYHFFKHQKLNICFFVQLYNKWMYHIIKFIARCFKSVITKKVFIKKYLLISTNVTRKMSLKNAGYIFYVCVLLQFLLLVGHFYNNLLYLKVKSLTQCFLIRFRISENIRNSFLLVLFVFDR